MKPIVLLLSLAALVTGYAHASPITCPQAAVEGAEAKQFSEQHAKTYLKAENLLLREDNPAEAISVLAPLRASNALNTYERQAILTLLAAAHMHLEEYREAASLLERGLHLGSSEPIGAQMRTYSNIIELYRYSDDSVSEARILQVWSACGGDEAALLETLNRRRERCGPDATPRSLCIKPVDAD